MNLEASDGPIIEVRGVHKWYGQFHVLKDINLEQKRADVEILSVWKDLMDPEIVEHAKPANLHKGTLFVDVDSSVWLDEIVRYRQRDILRNMQNRFGREKIRKISFRIG